MAITAELFDGTQLEFPDGTDPSVIQETAKRLTLEKQQKETPKPKEGVIASFQRGLESGLSTGRTGIESLFGNAEQAVEAGEKRKEDIQRRLGGGESSLEKIKKAYADKGLLSATGTLLGEIPEAISEQAPNILATLASARTGAMLGAGVAPTLGPYAPAAPIVGGLIGAFLPSYIQQFGGDVERQAQVQKEAGKPVDISKSNALMTAIPQAGLDVASTFIPFGGKIAGKVFGPGVEKLLASGSTEAAEKLAKESFLKTVTVGTGKTSLMEMPTEVGQQMLERLQAGLDLTSPDALKEYGETAFDVALLGPLGILGRVSDKASARQKIVDAQQKAQSENKTQEVTIEVADQHEPQTFFVAPSGDIAQSLEQLDQANQFKQINEAKLQAATPAPEAISPEDKLAIETARAEEARRNSPAMQKLNAIQVEAERRRAEAQAKADEKYASQSAFPGAESVNGLYKPPTPEEIAAQKQVEANKAAYDYMPVAIVGKDGVGVFAGKLSANGKAITYVDEEGKRRTYQTSSKNVIVNPTEQDIMQSETGLLKGEQAKLEESQASLRGANQKTTDDFKKFLRNTPIADKYADDILDDIKRTLNPSKTGYRPLSKTASKGFFAEDGANLDELASMAHDQGFISDEEFNDPSDTGGVKAFMAKVNQVHKGNYIESNINADKLAELGQSANMAENLQREIEKRQEAVSNVPTEDDLAGEFNAGLQQYLDENTDRFRSDIESAQQQYGNLDQFDYTKPNGEPGNKIVDDLYRKYTEEYAKQPKAEREMNPTDKFFAEGKQMVKDMRATLDRMGLSKVGLRLEETLTAMIDGKPEPVSGLYESVRNLISVSLSSSNPIRSLNHEALHALKELGMFTPKEWSMLENKAKSTWMAKYDIASDYGHLDIKDQYEEAIAKAFGDYGSQPANVQTLINRAKNFLKSLGNFLIGRGFDSVDKIFQRAKAGELKGKETSFGRKSQAEIEGRKVTLSEAFKKWFGNSKIVNKDGSPMIVYHGSGEDINEFIPYRKRNGIPSGGGLYFTKDPKYASAYAENASVWGKGESPSVYPAYLSIKNPLIINNLKDTDLRTTYLSKQQIDDLISKGYDGIINNPLDEIIAFNSNQVKSAIGNIGKYSSESNDIRAERTRDLNMKGVDEDYANKIREQFTQKKATVMDKINEYRPNLYERIITGLFDEFRGIKKYSEKSYMLARMSKSIDGALEGLLMHGQVFLDGGALNIKPGSKGLIDILKPLGSEVDQYQIWKALNRDAQLPADKRSFPADLVAGRDKLIKGDLNGKSRASVYQTALKEENALNKSVLDVAKQQGLLDDESYKRFSDDIFYIPFYKAVEDGTVEGMHAASKLTNQRFSKALKGGDKKTNDFMENVLMNWSHILSASMKNGAAVDTLKSAEQLGGATRVKSTYEGKDVVKVQENGKQSYWSVTDPFLYDSIALISYTGPKSPFLDIAKSFTSMLRYGVTLSPAYKVRNLIRDSIQSAATSDLSMGIMNNVVNGMKLTDKGHPTFVQALVGGGVFEMGTAHEGDQAKLIKRLVKQGVDETTILDSKEKIKAGLQKALDWYNEQGNRFENANRLALYDKLRKEGKSHLEASFAARDLMDFSLRGSWPALKIVSQVVPFFNARLQGLYKLGRDGITPTYRVMHNVLTGEQITGSDKKKALHFTVISSAVMMASMMLYMAFKDDEDFKRREDWDRDNFWWFKAGDTIFRIPKPFEIGALGTIAERTLEQVTDENVEGKVFGQRMRSILSDTFAMNPIPQVFKPMVDLYSNKDSFTGAPIESAGMERLSKQERKTESTSELAKALGGLSGIGAKILTANPEAEGFSPVQMDYAVKAYFGWLGGTAASISDKAVQPWSDVEKPSKPLTDTLAMGFVKTLPETQSKYVSQFYENNTRINQALADMKRYAENGDSEAVNKILAEKGNLIALQSSYDKTVKQMAEIRKYMNYVTKTKDMDSADKQNELNRMKILISEMAKNMEDARRSLEK